MAICGCWSFLTQKSVPGVRYFGFYGLHIHVGQLILAGFVLLTQILHQFLVYEYPCDSIGFLAGVLFLSSGVIGIISNVIATRPSGSIHRPRGQQMG